MHFERLVIENGDRSIAFDLHPNLTVIAGLGQLERDALAGELIGALGSARPGVHLELTADDGHRFAVFRPDGAAHRVVDVDGKVDVTSQFTGADGAIDLLARAGLDPRSARRVMRMGPTELAETTERDALIAQLARVDQQELWVAAEALRGADQRLEAEARAIGAGVEDAEVIERIEARHAAFERSQEQSESVRRATFLTAGFAALSSVPLARAIGLVAVAVLATVAVVAVAVSILYWRRMESARVAEEEALAEAGAQSYLGFHLQRVNSLLSSDMGRQRLLRASEEQREAAQRWRVIAGDVDVEWAVSNRSAIATAAKVRAEVRSFTDPADPGHHDRTALAANAVVARLESLRRIGPGGESFPALLDDPFVALDPGALPALLELLVRGSRNQQVLLLTESDAIAEWAKVESMTGGVAMIEPTPVAGTVQL